MLTFAQRAKKIQAKYPNADKSTRDKESMMDELKALAKEQEEFKHSMKIENTGNKNLGIGKLMKSTENQFAVGGFADNTDPPKWLKYFTKDNLKLLEKVVSENYSLSQEEYESMAEAIDNINNYDPNFLAEAKSVEDVAKAIVSTTPEYKRTNEYKQRKQDFESRFPSFIGLDSYEPKDYTEPLFRWKNPFTNPDNFANKGEPFFENDLNRWESEFPINPELNTWDNRSRPTVTSEDPNVNIPFIDEPLTTPSIEEGEGDPDAGGVTSTKGPVKPKPVSTNVPTTAAPVATELSTTIIPSKKDGLNVDFSATDKAVESFLNTIKGSKTDKVESKTEKNSADMFNIASGIAAVGSNIANLNSVKDPKRITPHAYIPTVSTNYIDKDFYRTFMGESTASAREALASKSSNYEEYVQSLRAVANDANNRMGEIGITIDEKNAAIDRENNKILSSASLINSQANNQADIDVAARKDYTNLLRQNYRSAIGENISNIFKDLADSRMAKEAGELAEKLAKLRVNQGN